MRNTSRLSVVVACCVLLIAPSALRAEATPSGLRPPLGSVLEAASPLEKVPVSVVLREQVSTELLRQAGAGLARKEARRAVVGLLRERARLTQAPLLERLRVLASEGKVSRVRPLWIGNVVGVDAVPEVVREIASRAEVAWVNHNPEVDVFLGPRYTMASGVGSDPLIPLDATAEIECGVQRMRAPEVWSDFGVTGSGAVVAVIDTGVCWTHSDIASQMWVNPGEDLDHDGVVMDVGDQNGLDDDGNGFVDDLIGWDFDNGDNEPNDDNSHGSHCAGTVAGDGTAGTQSGMAPDAKIMAVKVGVSFADEVDVWSGMQYAAENGADAISMSLGWPHNQNPDRATWRQNCESTIEAGTAMVIAAGNEGWGAEPDNVRTPGDVPRVITVGATDCGDAIAGFSSRGPVTWQSVPPYNDHPYPPGLIKPDVSAPGVDTKSHDVCSGYSFKSGTSMATPHVAGAVALMVSNSPGLTHDDLKQILEETSVDLGSPGKDNEYGMGRVDAYEAVQGTATPDGRMAIKEASASCQGLLTLTVTDADLKGTGQLTMEVFSTTETLPENVLLIETGPTSGVFRGSVITDGGAVAVDGEVQVRDGDTITARYWDANDGQGGLNVPKTDTALADCAGPRIDQVGETGISDVQATVVWTTDEASTSTVHWGEIKPPQSTNGNSAVVRQHNVLLTGLSACTVYWYSVESRDVPGNVTLDDNGGLYHYFETWGDFGNGLQPCHAGSVTIDRSIVSCSDALSMRLVDLDLNLSPTAIDTAVLTISSSSETTPETLVLAETGPNTSQFTGSIPTASGSPVAGDGILQVQGADVLTATYHDANDGSGTAAVAFDTAVTDCTGPDFSGVQVTDLTDESAIVRWTTSEPGTSRVEWGPTAALGNVATDGALVTSHAITIRPLTECGRFYLRVSSTDVYGNTRVYDAAGAPFEFNAYLIPGIYKDRFESSSGWTLGGEWQIGGPQGRGSAPADPTQAFEGTQVLGHDLTGLGAHPGDYEPGTDQRAESPVINASALTGGQIKLRRWLNTGSGAAIPYVEVKVGSTYTAVWTGSSLGETASAWSLQTIDISSVADGRSAIQIVFRQKGGFATAAPRSGWNVDRLVVKGANQPDWDTCGACGGAPTFAGLERAVDAAGCADTGVQLSWKAAPAWGTGRGGTYTIFRDTNPAFTPSAANRIAAGVAGTSYTDTGAPNNVGLYYVVRAENDETCSTGANNGGVTETNLVRIAARDDTSQPAPGDVGSTLRVDNINDAHVRLTWTAAPNAATHRVYRAQSPQGPFTLLSEVTGALYEDKDQLGNSTNWYYRVNGVDACGNEGP